jgi:hypothetical protein
MAAVVAFAAALLMGSSARAADVQCGDRITQDTVLMKDLSCPNTFGLLIEADNVTLDLGGHTIRGAKPDDAAWVAIQADDVRNVTIKRGTILGFLGGVFLRRVRGARIEGLRVCYSSSLAFVFRNSGDITVSRSEYTRGWDDGSSEGEGSTNIQFFESEERETCSRPFDDPPPVCSFCDIGNRTPPEPKPPVIDPPPQPFIPEEQPVPTLPATPAQMRREANRWLLNHYASWGRAKKTRRLACSVTVCHAGWTSHGKRRQRTLLMQGYGVGRVAP